MLDNPRMNDIEFFKERKKLFKNISSRRNNQLKALRNEIKIERSDDLNFKTTSQPNFKIIQPKQLEIQSIKRNLDKEVNIINSEIARHKENSKKKNIKTIKKAFNLRNITEMLENRVPKETYLNQKLESLTYRHLEKVVEEKPVEDQENIDRYVSKETNSS